MDAKKQFKSEEEIAENNENEEASNDDAVGPDRDASGGIDATHKKKLKRQQKIKEYKEKAAKVPKVKKGKTKAASKNASKNPKK